MCDLREIYGGDMMEAVPTPPIKDYDGRTSDCRYTSSLTVLEGELMVAWFVGVAPVSKASSVFELGIKLETGIRVSF